MKLLPTVSAICLLWFCSGCTTPTSQRSASADAHDVASSPSRAAGDYDPKHLNLLDEVVEASIKAGETAGAVLLVGHRGEIVYEKAFGHRSLEPTREAMTVNTIFDMASLTKVLATATSIMILVEEGRLSLTDRLVTYLPEFAPDGQSCSSGAEKACVTLLHALTHYSGLPPDVDWSRSWSGYDTALRMGFEERLQSRPGERFVYSDIGYFLLGEVVARVSGQPLEVFSRQRIFEPLGMVDTGFRPPPQLRSRIAPSEPRKEADPAAPVDDVMLRGRVHDPTTDRMGGVAGHAGLFSTASDVARFAQMILGEGQVDGVRILSPLGVRAMTSPQSPAGRTQLRGIGFDIETPFSTVRGDLFPVGSFGHTGYTGTSLWIDPSTETFVVLLTNRLHPDGKGNVVSLRRKTASVVAASLRPKDPNGHRD